MRRERTNDSNGVLRLTVGNGNSTLWLWIGLLCIAGVLFEVIHDRTGFRHACCGGLLIGASSNGDWALLYFMQYEVRPDDPIVEFCFSIDSFCCADDEPNLAWTLIEGIWHH